MDKQPTALAKVIEYHLRCIDGLNRHKELLLLEYKNTNKTNMAIKIHKQAIEYAKSLLPYERETMESCLNIDINHYPPNTATDYFNQTYTQDGK